MTAQLIQIAPNLIAASLTNPRKTFDQVKLAELAESIRVSGLHTPVLVRPLPGSRAEDTFRHRGDGNPLPTHELVSGERRLRACIMAEQATIPAIVRELTDAEALEIQVIENLQRDDLAALEEAEGYEQLMKASGLTADQVAEKIGKSRSYVYGRLKLLDLCPEARDAVRAGQLDASKALMLARVPTHKLQLRALKEFTHPNHQGETLSARAAQTWLRTNLMLRLDTAVFNTADAQLLPAAGSCQQCPKRTGANPELFHDVDSADICTDTTCFHDKIDAHTEQVVAAARKRGLTVIEGEEAAKVKPYPSSGPYTHLRGYESLDKTIDLGEGATTSLRQQLSPKELKEHTALLVDPHTQTPIEVIPEEVARAVYEKLRQQTKPEEAAEQKARAQARELERKKEALTCEYHERWRGLAVDAIVPRVKAGEIDRFELGMLRAILFHTTCHDPDTSALEQLLGSQDVEWYEETQALKAIESSPANPGLTLLQLCLEYERDASFEWNNSARVYIDRAPMIEACAERLGIDLAAIRNQVQADMRAAFAELEKASEPLPSAAQAPKPRKGKPGKNSPAAGQRLSADEAKQGIAEAMQSQETAADDGRGETDHSDAGEAHEHA